MKKIAILQSNYIPWKGYFDMIAAVDECIIYDDMQYTRQDWRNRNKIKTPKGAEWISVPVGTSINRSIKEVQILTDHWQKKHWATLQSNYGRAEYFDEVAAIIKPIYQQKYGSLSELNRIFIETICNYMAIKTKISNSWDYILRDGKSERLADLCVQAGAAEYLSGPAAKNYIDEKVFSDLGIKITWFDYSGYPVYPQLWGDFLHGVSVLDLLFNCGEGASRYMRYVDL